MILNKNDYRAFVASIDLLSLHCPACGAVGLFILYGHYKRFVIIDDISSGDCKIEISVQHIQYTQCKSTQALLPTNFVPYTQFTYLFIYYIVTLDENDDLIIFFTNTCFRISESFFKRSQYCKKSSSKTEC